MSDAPLGPPSDRDPDTPEPGAYPPPPQPPAGYPPPPQEPPGYPPPPQPPSGYPPPGYPPPGYPPPGYPPQQAGYPPGYGYPPAGPHYASWGARLGAYLIDALITTAFFIPAIIVLAAGPTELESCSVDEEGDIVFDEPDNAICEVPTNGTIAATIGLGVVALAAGAFYFAKLEGSTGQTVGKKAVGITVVDVNTGQPIGVGRGVGRYFARWLSAIPCYLGYLWPLWDQQKQTFHDKIVTTVVVKR